MIKEKTVIGLTSFALSGKDTFFKVLNKIYPNSKRFSLADSLKQELAVFIQNQYNIDIFNCTTEEKTKIRPLMVLHAKIRREDSDNRYFLDRLTKKIIHYHQYNPTGLAIVTDIRHQSDADWLQNELGGILVHIKRYSEVTRITGNQHYSINSPIKKFLEAPNEVEAADDPLLQVRANYRIEWPTLPNKTDLTPLEIYAEEFVKYLNR